MARKQQGCVTTEIPSLSGLQRPGRCVLGHKYLHQLKPSAKISVSANLGTEA